MSVCLIHRHWNDGPEQFWHFWVPLCICSAVHCTRSYWLVWTVMLTSDEAFLFNIKENWAGFPQKGQGCRWGGGGWWGMLEWLRGVLSFRCVRSGRLFCIKRLFYKDDWTESESLWETFLIVIILDACLRRSETWAVIMSAFGCSF